LFQVLIDHTDINTLTTLYVSIYLGITLKFLLAQSVEFTFMDSLANPANTKIIHPLFLYKKASRLNRNLILNRIVKYIRKKESSKDDSEKPISFAVQPYLLTTF